MYNYGFNALLSLDKDAILKILFIVVVIVILYLLLMSRDLFSTKSKSEDDQVAVKKVAPQIEKRQATPEEEVKEEAKVVNQPVTVESSLPKEEKVESFDMGYENDSRYNFSFVARLTLAPEESLVRYNDLKNFMISYPGVSTSFSWKEESFLYKNKAIVKLRIHGQTIRLFLALDPKEYEGSKYNFVDQSKTREHRATPLLFRVKGSRGMAHAKQLINDVFNQLGVARGYDLGINEDYRLPVKSREELLQEGLIKVVK